MTLFYLEIEAVHGPCVVIEYIIAIQGDTILQEEKLPAAAKLFSLELFSVSIMNLNYIYMLIYLDIFCFIYIFFIHFHCLVNKCKLNNFFKLNFDL